MFLLNTYIMISSILILPRKFMYITKKLGQRYIFRENAYNYMLDLYP